MVLYGEITILGGITMANLRKEQEKLAVLLEISDIAKKNADIVKGAESRMIITEELARVLSDKKTTVLKKELQFVLYFLKKDELVNVESRGNYTSNSKTVEELIRTAHVVSEGLKTDEKAVCLLDSETIEEMEIICATRPLQVKNEEDSSGFELLINDEPAPVEKTEDKADEMKVEETHTFSKQVDKEGKPSKKSKIKKK